MIYPGAREVLEDWQRQSDVKLARRAWIVTAAEDGSLERDLGKATGRRSSTTVQLVKNYRLMGPPGLLDEPRSGRPSKISDEAMQRIDRYLHLVGGRRELEIFSANDLAVSAGVSRDAIWRRTRARDVSLNRTRNRSLSLRRPDSPASNAVVVMVSDELSLLAFAADNADAHLTPAGLWLRPNMKLAREFTRRYEERMDWLEVLKKAQPVCASGAGWRVFTEVLDEQFALLKRFQLGGLCVSAAVGGSPHSKKFLSVLAKLRTMKLVGSGNAAIRNLHYATTVERWASSLELIASDPMDQRQSARQLVDFGLVSHLTWPGTGKSFYWRRDVA
ncbi:MAG: helix-turn-helix domain-containing protein [Proteobacteria bacterium]|nr:helix-turn-helix domain-containing protein [Pseudomonadota bacterium]